jgi:acyl-CoA synthetase (NDP forming)
MADWFGPLTGRRKGTGENAVRCFQILKWLPKRWALFIDIQTGRREKNDGKVFDIRSVKKEGRSILTEFESKKILKQAGIPVVETRLAKDSKEAVSLSQKMGFPVALKINSPDVVHKSDSGGVKLSLNNATQVKKAYDEILKKVATQYPDAAVHGVSVQKMVLPGTEVIVGTTKDPQFGPVIMFGLGGIFVEVLKDVSFRIVPINQRDAQEMIEETKGYPLLKGYRGKEPADIPFLVEMMLKVSKFVEENPQIKELDLNPIFAYAKVRLLSMRDYSGIGWNSRYGPKGCVASIGFHKKLSMNI